MITFASLLRPAAVGGAVAAGLNLALYFAAPALGADLVGEYNPGAAPSTLPAVMVIVASIIPAFGAAGLLTLLGRFTPKAPTVFAAVAAVFTVVSFGGPAGLAGASTATKVVLAAMHVVAAVPIAAALYGAARKG